MYCNAVFDELKKEVDHENRAVMMIIMIMMMMITAFGATNESLLSLINKTTNDRFGIIMKGR